MKSKGRESLNELELSVGKFMELKSQDKVLIELRDHLLDLYQRVISSYLKTQVKAEAANAKTLASLESEKDMLQRQFNEAREAIKSLEQRQEDTLARYNMLKAEYQQLADETASQAKQREQEQAEAVNYEFVKNALVSYLTSRE